MSAPLPKIAFYTLGCKLNFAETAAIAQTVEAEGYAQTEFNEPSDFYVINTCSVTEKADKELQIIIRRALRINPVAKVIVIGCYAQLKPGEIAKFPGVSMVLGAKEKFKLHEHLNKLQDQTGTIVEAGEIEAVQSFSPAWSHGERTRTFLKIQDGCDYFCSFCTIPFARGASRSASIAETVANAQKAAAEGAKEIVLTGVNIGDFGKTPDGSARTDEDFFQLIQVLNKEVEVPRFRISSIEPNLLREEIIDFVANSKRIMPHFHIPLQSGSNKTLKYMRRRYLREVYEDRVKAIKQLMPHCCIGVDVIVGFPGETDEDFLETYNFLNKLDVSYFHVFTYSERANTRALKIDGVVPIDVRKERNQRLRILSEKKRQAFYRQFDGTVRPVLWESDNHDGTINGFTDNYIKVETTYEEHLPNTITDFLLSTKGNKIEAGFLKRSTY